jgi:hypothetical protein
VRPRRRSAERLTWGLAGLALATAGTVVFGELAKLAGRRTRASLEELGDDGSPTVRETAEHALIATGQAASDTVAVAREGLVGAPHYETVLFNMLSGFLGAFSIARVSTWGMRETWWPLGTVRLGGRHIHHFVPGILVAFASGATAIVSDNRKLESALAIPFGAGVGLTFDEAALLLDLRDVYWTREGIVSVQVSLGTAVLLGATILGLRILRRGERMVEEQGLIPPAPEGGWLGFPQEWSLRGAASG